MEHFSQIRNFLYLLCTFSNFVLFLISVSYIHPCKNSVGSLLITLFFKPKINLLGFNVSCVFFLLMVVYPKRNPDAKF